MLILFSLFAFIGPVNNVGLKPEDLIEACKQVRLVNGQTQSSQICLSYIAGIVDGQQFVDKSPACFPPNVTLGQMTEAVLKYAGSHPNSLHQTSAGLVTNALRVSFPCTGVSKP